MIDNMTRDERNLLLYLETCEVDRQGLVDARKMNREDFDIAMRWNEGGFLRFGRLKMDELRSLYGANNAKAAESTYYVRLGDDAWAAAAVLRRRRAAEWVLRWEATNFVPVGLAVGDGR